ncbi:SDR family oxidoreductase [Phormidium sp. FACHB-1136]|uniref:UDP-glucose 4-epimerase family protein n=1 Tax=Phormidium sp. FACHB-1136 TaxID=2692848 RepID=UPI00168770F3|nr:SDR family oxidoreductase [Phormidium sp. FACHB-1136]MBD2424584.1 SDR family oxidoreductase [Phormidium sp. FACHB-1136]
MKNGTILVTGASGFVGQSLCFELLKRGECQDILGIYRSQKLVDTLPRSIRPIILNSLQDIPQSIALEKVGYVVHLAARVHQMQDTAADPLAAFRTVNTTATANLAQAAALAGVKRFIYLSSIKVNGEYTPIGQPFTAQDSPNTQDPYGISKAEAEVQLRHIAQTTGMEVVIIRPPLVYGPGVKANFLSLMRWLDKGYPLPLGAIHNRRSLLALPNLVDLITTCLTHPAAANQTFLVSDNEDLSTTDLLRRLAKALDKPARLIPVPMPIIQSTAQIIGKPALAQRLCGSLQVDISKTQTLLGWTPPVSVDQGLRLTAQHFQQSRKR